ncbi:phytanoyl-CoA dioxygenase family protein [Flavilitoribacter nigricans]|uniref:Phytanoyl-CoA dioxygenase n=1 Tax=Flavilitoribacter nigricans (strain ATCC 23147 / DSM 23189 / NBRC 102662 / NCIMB 1420 / SS-2) TaxID=1122177 RepID=A0A2D0NB22_FLAN2|nr:phytanoyl-CoA dioxygenase family protein [Flavilitoribacter nigricans]PHN05711.1 phytanoyl-CoA dioxygenase [Flavilitoribacter nigricans DSM 23189 = NBRC 102662]
MESLLEQMGVQQDTLSKEEKAFLDQNGYLNLGRLLDDDALDSINRHLQSLLQAEGEHAGSELMDSPYIRHPKEEGADRLADLVNKGSVFDIFYTHPKVLAAMAHILGPQFKLSSLNYRAAKPGKGLQKLHADWHEAVSSGEYKVCNSIWLLDDFSRANGATRIVPGTQLQGDLPQDVLDDPWDPHPDEVVIEAPAGSVFIFNSHTWHGGTNNSTDRPRRAVHSYFCRADQPQQVDQKRYIQADTRNRLSPAAQQILGV